MMLADRRSSKAREVDWGMVGAGWDSFSIVTVSSILITSSCNHLFRNDRSIAAQFCFSCCGYSSNHLSASLCVLRLQTI